MANVFSSISDYLSGGNQGNALQLTGNAVTRLQNTAVPDLPALAAQMKEEMLAGTMSPAQYQAAMQQVVGKMDASGMDTTALQADSGMNNVTRDAASLQGQRDALSQLDELGRNNGLSNADRAQFQSTIAQNDADARASGQAALDRRAAQGSATSGDVLATQLAAQQGASNRNAAAGASVAQAAQARALQAIQAGLAGNADLNKTLYSQDASKASAQDAVNQFNTSTKNSVAQFNAQQQQAAALANFQAQQQAEAARIAAQNQANQYNATNQQQANQTNTQIKQNAAKTGYDAQQQQYEDTLARENAAAGAASRAASAAAAAGQSTATGAGNLINSALGAAGGVGGIVNGVKGLFGGSSGSDALTGLGNTASYGIGNSIPDTAASYGSGVAGYPGGAPTGWDGGFFGGVGNTLSDWGSSISDGLGSLFSDEDLKTGKRKLSDEECDKIMEGIVPMKFKYKGDKSNPGQSGVMAQDMEKSGLKNSVIDTPAGKMIQPKNDIGSILAVIANNNQRLRKLEGKN